MVILPDAPGAKSKGPTGMAESFSLLPWSVSSLDPLGLGWNKLLGQRSVTTCSS